MDNAYLNQTVTYSYDAGGNILSKTTYPYTTGSLEGQTGETVTYSYGDSEWKDLLTAYNGQAITYDEIGNPLSYKNGFTFTWQNGRRLATAVANGKSLSFEYDDSGYRTQKKVNGVATDYLLDGDKIVSQIYNNQQIWFDYDAAGTRHAMEYNGNSYYYYYNLQGDVIGLYDSSLNSVVQYTYDSWGKLLSVTGSLAETVGKANPFRYRGYYYDSETELYYLNSRYYDPEIGRWINADDAIAGVDGDVWGYNLFCYCMNNPVNMDDHTGHWPKWLKIAAGAVVNAAKKAATVISKTVKSAISSVKKIAKASTSSLPKKGKPGSSKTLPNSDGTPKQKRWYGPDGNPERDRDYNHPGNMPFPHDHSWENGKRGTEHLPPDPSYKMNWEPVIGVGVVAICVVGIIAVAADDITGIGVADDFLFGPLGVGVGEGLIMIFG